MKLKDLLPEEFWIKLKIRFGGSHAPKTERVVNQESHRKEGGENARLTESEAGREENILDGRTGDSGSVGRGSVWPHRSAGGPYDSGPIGQ